MLGIIRGLQDFLFVGNKFYQEAGSNLEEMLAVSEFKLLKQMFQQFVVDLTQYFPLTAALKHADCDPSRPFGFDPNGLRLNLNATSCDFNVTAVTLSGGDDIPDGSYVVVCTFGVLALVVGVFSCNGITVPLPHRVAAINGALGTLTATMIFVGGLNIER
jgi:hypothetical protein